MGDDPQRLRRHNKREIERARAYSQRLKEKDSDNKVASDSVDKFIWRRMDPEGAQLQYNSDRIGRIKGKIDTAFLFAGIAGCAILIEFSVWITFALFIALVLYYFKWSNEAIHRKAESSFDWYNQCANGYIYFLHSNPVRSEWYAKELLKMKSGPIAKYISGSKIFSLIDKNHIETF